MPIRQIVYEVQFRMNPAILIDKSPMWYIFGVAPDYKQARRWKTRLKAQGYKSKVLELVTTMHTISR